MNKMIIKKAALCLAGLTMVASTVLAQTNSDVNQAWISNDLRTGVHAAPEMNSAFKGTVKAGETVTVLERSDDGQYVKIRTPSISGWIRAEHIYDQPSFRAQVESSQKNLVQAQRELALLQSNQSDHSEQLLSLKQSLNTAQQEAQRAKDDLLRLQRSAENVVAIDTLNSELQNKVVRLEQENVQLTQQNERLQHDRDSRAMIIGGGLVLAGMVLCWLLHMVISGRRRRGSFNDF